MTTSWVFGGSEGIGLAVVHRLVARGDRVVVLSRSEAKLAAVRAELPDVVTRSVDVADPEAVAAVVASLVAEQGAPDLVVTTAGYARPGWLDELPPDDVRGMVDVNLLGTIHVARAAVPHLRTTRGTFVATSSLAGLAGVFGYTVYSATKFGIIGFAEALRREVAPDGVQVRVLCPPNTTTPGFATENLHKPAEVLAAEEKASTMSADAVADALLRALRRRRPFVVVPGRGNRASAWAIRHLPRVVDRALRRPT